MKFSEYYPEYFTATILDWQHLLRNDAYKGIITDSLSYLVNNNRVKVFGFVIMSNHIHIILQVMAEHKPRDVQLSFMKFTAQMLLKDLRNKHPEVLATFRVDASDRKYQIWKRNALDVQLWSQVVFKQKLDYIHHNPVKAGICRYPEEYRFSSAAYYETGTSEWSFLTHYQG